MLVEEAGSDVARDTLLSADELLAPDWIRMEVAHALWKKVKNEGLNADHVIAANEALPNLLDELVECASLLPQALQLSLQLQHSPYDCLYLAAALRRETFVITADVKFVAAAKHGGLGQRVQLLAQRAN